MRPQRLLRLWTVRDRAWACSVCALISLALTASCPYNQTYMQNCFLFIYITAWSVLSFSLTIHSAFSSQQSLFKSWKVSLCRIKLSVCTGTSAWQRSEKPWLKPTGQVTSMFITIAEYYITGKWAEVKHCSRIKAMLQFNLRSVHHRA